MDEDDSEIKILPNEKRGNFSNLEKILVDNTRERVNKLLPLRDFESYGFLWIKPILYLFYFLLIALKGLPLNFNKINKNQFISPKETSLNFNKIDKNQFISPKETSLNRNTSPCHHFYPEGVIFPQNNAQSLKIDTDNPFGVREYWVNMFLLRDNPFRVKNIALHERVIFNHKIDDLLKKLTKSNKHITLPNLKISLDTKHKYKILTSIYGLPLTKRKAFVGTENRFI